MESLRTFIRTREEAASAPCGFGGRRCASFATTQESFMTFELGNPVLPLSLAAVLALCGGSALAEKGKDDHGVVRAQLSGFQEVPVVSTTGNGEFRARIDTQTNEIEYEFSYSDLQAPVLQAHIHLGQHSVNGGILVWLCQTATNPAPAAVAHHAGVQQHNVFVQRDHHRGQHRRARRRAAIGCRRTGRTGGRAAAVLLRGGKAGQQRPRWTSASWASEFEPSTGVQRTQADAAATANKRS